MSATTDTRPWSVPGVPTYMSALGADTAADALFYLALGWVAAHSGGAMDAAVIIAAGTIPRIAVMLLGGVIGDRYGLSRVATLTLALRTVLMLAFVAMLHFEQLLAPAPLAALAALVGLADALHMPAMGGMAGLLAPEGAQAAVQGLVSTITRVSTVVATGLGGLLLGWNRPSIGWLAAAFLACALIALLALRRSPAGSVLAVVDTDENEGSMNHMLRAGLDQVRRDRIVVLVLILFTLANLAATAPIILGMPLKAAEYHWTGLAYGAAYLGFAAGSAVGAFTISKQASKVSNNLYGALGLLLPGAAALAVLALAANPWAAGVACFVTGLFLAPAAALMLGEVRERTPGRLMGRVSSVVQFSIFALIPVGHLVFGWLVTQLDLRTAGLCMSGGLLATVAIVAVLGRSAGRGADAPA